MNNRPCPLAPSRKQPGDIGFSAGIVAPAPRRIIESFLNIDDN
jgi:hypothetical protein